jgi:hypothetical protein
MHAVFCPTRHRARRSGLDVGCGGWIRTSENLWDLRAYETRELDRATLLRNKWQAVPVLPRTRFGLEAKLHSWCPA